jgi:DNA-binding NarL/FixJ family response regulator
MEERNNTTVIIADDLRLVREGIALLCESTGRYRVIDQCGDGAETLDLIRENRPDLVVLDLNLPRVYTLEIVRKIRAEEMETLVVVLSSRGDRKLVLEALRSGVNAFILKTASTYQFLDALQQIEAGGVYVSPELQLEKIILPTRRHECEDPLEMLSSREYQVFTLLIDGIRAKEIAARLDLSPKTVDTYRASLMRKLDIHDVAGLVKFAIQRDLTTVA